MMRRVLHSSPVALLAICLFFTCATRAQSYTLTPNITFIPAASYGSSIHAGVVGDTSSALDFNVCFYTGYGSAAAITPSSFTPSSSGSAEVVFIVPASTIQEVPPTAFASGVFNGLLYTVPLSTTSCAGSSQASNAVSLPITFPILNSISLSSVPQQNPNLNNRLPARLELLGSNFTGQTSSSFPSPSTVVFTANGSFTGSVSFTNNSALSSSIPTQIPGDTTSVEVTVCNTAVFSYCSAPLPLTMKPLQSNFGTLTAVPTAGKALQPINLSATFGPGSPSTAGAPSGLVTFTDAGTSLASSPLLLDTTASFVAAPHSSFKTSSLPLQPIVADFNNDGIPDIAFIEPNAVKSGVSYPVIHVVQGMTPAGQFGADVPYNGFESIPCGTPLSMVTADFNGDGYLDLAVLCENTSAGGATSEVVYTLLNKRNGAFTYLLNSYGPVFGAGLTAADFNHDGKSDLLVAGALDTIGNTGLQVLLGMGDGTFTAGPSSSGLDAGPSTSFGGYQIAAADFNSDGFPDLAILNAAGTGSSVDNFIQLFQNDGKGSFTRAGTVQTDGTNTAKFFIASLLPGQPKDLIVTSASSAPGIYVVSNLSAADVSFAGTSQFTSVPGLIEAYVGDFNGDGFLDIAVDDAKSFHVLNGDGTGAFSTTYAALSVAPPSGATLIAASDENGDGYADLIAVSSSAVGSLGSTTTIYNFITSGTASTSFLASNLASGVHRILASTPGTVEIAGASAETTVTITGAGSITSIAASVNSPQSFGAPITLYGSVLDPTATGTLSFYSGTALFGTANLSTASGALFASGSITLQPLPAGTYSFQVVYSGDATHASTTSAILPFTINPIAPLVAWTPDITSVAYGAPLSASELDAIASGLAGVSVPGTFAYVPAPGTVLGIGTHTLSVTFTPTSTNYLPATATTSITVNPATPVIVWAPNPATIVYGTLLSAAQLDAYAATPNVNTVPGTLTYTPALGTLLATGTQTLNVAFIPTDSVDYRPASSSVSITVGKASPVLTWATPAPTVVGTALSATQLDATAAAADGSALPGSFTYTPPAGTVLASGSQKLSVVFVPTDTADYSSASANVTISVTADTLATLFPNTGSLGDPATTVTLTGTGFLSTSIVQMNGIAVPTTFVSSTTLTAIVPAVQLKTVQAIQVTVNDPVQNQTSNALAFNVTAPSTMVGVSAPTTITPASQNTVTFQLSPYPADVNATFTLAFQPASGLTDDPMIVFASSGERTASALVPAHSTAVSLPIEFESGTVAGTLTLTLTLEAGGANVTPSSIQPIVIQEPVAVPGISSVTLEQDGNVLTVITRGYSNTRAVTSAAFHFTASSGHSVKTPDLTIPVDPIFSTWYTNSTSQQYGSEFTYTESFNLDSNASAIGQVSVTLTNDSGTSQEAKTP